MFDINPLIILVVIVTGFIVVYLSNRQAWKARLWGPQTFGWGMLFGFVCICYLVFTAIWTHVYNNSFKEVEERIYGQLEGKIDGFPQLLPFVQERLKDGMLTKREAKEIWTKHDRLLFEKNRNSYVKKIMEFKQDDIKTMKELEREHRSRPLFPPQ